MASDFLLRLSDRAAEIAAADAELDRNEALAALAIDERRAGIERDIGKLAERNVAASARRRLKGNLDVADGVDAVAVVGIEPDGQIELPVALQNGRRGGPAKCGLHHGVDITGVETVARRFFAIDLDVEVGLSEKMENPKIGHALDLGHLGHHLRSE